MATKYINWYSSSPINCPDCAGTVIMCIPPALVESGFKYIEGELIGQCLTNTGCNNTSWKAQLSYDDTQLVEDAVLHSSQISGVFCKDSCYANWLSNLITFTIGEIDSETKSLNGGVVTAGEFIFQTADINFPGLMSTVNQSFAGTKSFSNKVSLLGAGEVRAGSSIGTAQIGGTIYSDATTKGNTAGVETALFTIPVIADTLTSSEGVSFEAAGTFAATASVNKRILIYFGGQVIFDTGSLAVTAANSWYVRGKIVRTGALTQKAVVSYTSSYATYNATAQYTAPTQDISILNNIILTGTGTNANDVVSEFVNAKWEPL